jgi:hypothetical protein
MKRAVIVICDSLRTDLITPRDAPFLSEFGRSAARFTNHRSVFPSTTRTSAASIATGCLPAQHGLLGNTMAIDEGDGLVCLSVGKPDFRDRLHRATGRTLHRPTLAERVSRAGDEAIAISNVSPGAAYFLDPDGFGWVYNRPVALVPAAGRCPLRKGSPSPRATPATPSQRSGSAKTCCANAPRRSRCCGCRSLTTPAITRRWARRRIARQSGAPTPTCAA